MRLGLLLPVALVLGAVALAVYTAPEPPPIIPATKPLADPVPGAPAADPATRQERVAEIDRLRAANDAARAREIASAEAGIRSPAGEAGIRDFTTPPARTSIMAGCDVAGEVPLMVQVGACQIARSIHGNPGGMRLTVMVDSDVAPTIAAQTVEARNALASLANGWRDGIGRNLGYVEVFYGEAHLATVRSATPGRPAEITFH